MRIQVAAMALSLGAPAALAQQDIRRDEPVVTGKPYVVEGKTYTPADPASYDEVGHAATQKEPNAGDRTANGEPFSPTVISAAHKTLPLPSYVEVTALDSGQTILVRVNDRGPMRRDRIIALSPAAMEQLGAAGRDDVPVRVRRVSPPPQDRAMLRAGNRAANRLDTPKQVLQALRAKLAAADLAPHAPASVAAGRASPGRSTGGDAGRTMIAAPNAAPPTVPRAVAAKPAVPPPPAAAQRGVFVVQLGAFSTRAKAQALADRVQGRVEQAGTLWRVRTGPYGSRKAAQAGVAQAAAKGVENGSIISNDSP